MSEERIHGKGPDRTTEIAALEQENRVLADQVKRLIRAETRLYEYQQELDAQLREYQKLYELNRKFAGNFDIQKIFEHALDYVIHYLEYERVVFFRLSEDARLFSVCAAEGYYDESEMRAVAGLTIQEDVGFLAPLYTGAEYLICLADAEEGGLTAYRSKLLMNEYMIYPLGNRRRPSALLAVGNSAGNAALYRRVDRRKGALLGMGNLAGILSSTVETHISYASMQRALDQERITEAKYRGIFQNAAEGIFQTSAEGRFISCNPAGAAILGYDTPEELMEGVTDIEHQLYVDPQRRTELRNLMSGGNEVKNFEVELYRKDGSKQWVLMSIKPCVNEAHEINYMDGIMLDIAERKRAEEALKAAQEELVRKEKLSILGQLAGSVGHELRNPLGVMSNAVYYLKTILPDADSNVREYLNIIRQEIDNSLQIITDLLDFSRTKPARMILVPIDAWVDQSFGRCTLPENITVKTDIQDGLPLVNMDLFQMTQVLQNLITNAVQAMPDGGRLEIVAGLDRRWDTRAAASGRHAQEVVKIRVKDTGTGISPEHMAKLFQPLFTTKAKGIGLGLVVCKNLVEANGGAISVESRDGRGTTFTIVIPITKEEK